MLLFIIPIRSEMTSNSWENICCLFERTLRSVCNQTSQNFKVIVVCHEKPSINYFHENVEYRMVDFAPPQLTGDPANDLQKKCFDHKMKLWLGLTYAEHLNPTHVMFVDADDCVSCHLAQYVNTYVNKSGWYVDKGYEYSNNRSFIYPRSNLYQKCGSSNIIRYELLKPFLINKPSRSDADVDKKFFNHKLLRSYFDTTEHSLSPLPFRGTVYVTGHGDNYFIQYFNDKNKDLFDLIRLYGGKARKLFMARPLTEDIRKEFCL